MKHKQEKEKVLGAEAGASHEGVPKNWGEPKVEDIDLEGGQYRISSFPNPAQDGFRE